MQARCCTLGFADTEGGRGRGGKGGEGIVRKWFNSFVPPWPTTKRPGMKDRASFDTGGESSLHRLETNLLGIRVGPILHYVGKGFISVFFRLHANPRPPVLVRMLFSV